MEEMKSINTKKLKFMMPLLVVLLALAIVTPAFAQDGEPPTADQVNDIALGLNVMWMLIGGFLVFFMQAGFALVETGFTRNKNVTLSRSCTAETARYHMSVLPGLQA